MKDPEPLLVKDAKSSKTHHDEVFEMTLLPVVTSETTRPQHMHEWGITIFVTIQYACSRNHRQNVLNCSRAAAYDVAMTAKYGATKSAGSSHESV
jgi:hypothetical protein